MSTRKFSGTLLHSAKICVEVTGHRHHCKQLCGGMGIPRMLVFSCASKAKINRLKELSESKFRQKTLEDTNAPLGATT